MRFLRLNVYANRGISDCDRDPGKRMSETDMDVRRLREKGHAVIFGATHLAMVPERQCAPARHLKSQCFHQPVRCPSCASRLITGRSSVCSCGTPTVRDPD